MTGIFMFKMVNNALPNIFNDFFHFVRTIHHYPTRQKENLFIPKYRTTRCKFAIKFHGSIIWNRLPLDLRSLPSLHLFKRKLRDYLLQGIC